MKRHHITAIEPTIRLTANQKLPLQFGEGVNSKFMR